MLVMSGGRKRGLYRNCDLFNSFLSVAGDCRLQPHNPPRLESRIRANDNTLRKQRLMATPWTIGDCIEGRWEIHQILKGGMGVVYILYDREHQMPYAAKTFRDDKHSDSTERAADFTKEALTWVKLDVH